MVSPFSTVSCPKGIPPSAWVLPLNCVRLLESLGPPIANEDGPADLLPNLPESPINDVAAEPTVPIIFSYIVGGALSVAAPIPCCKVFNAIPAAGPPNIEAAACPPVFIIGDITLETPLPNPVA